MLCAAAPLISLAINVCLSHAQNIPIVELKHGNNRRVPFVCKIGVADAFEHLRKFNTPTHFLNLKDKKIQYYYAFFAFEMVLYTVIPISPVMTYQTIRQSLHHATVEKMAMLVRV